MAEIALDPSVKQGFDFVKTNPESLSFVGECKIGDKPLTADLDVIDPTTGDTKTVVGVVRNIDWSLSPTDPIYITMQVSNANKEAVNLLTMNEMTDVKVEIAFDHYPYDTKAAKFYNSFHTNETALKGLLYKQGKAYEIHLDQMAASDVLKPENFTLRIGFIPEPEEQDIHMAVSDTAKFVKKWGINEA